MKTHISILAVTVVLITAISGSFSTAPAGFSRAAQMRGSDATYGSTRGCVQGKCKVKTKNVSGQKNK
jgi:hypothetical protein